MTTTENTATMNNSFNNILVAIDFSDPSLNALETAVSLAGKTGASLFIVHAYDNILESPDIISQPAHSPSIHSSSILLGIAKNIFTKHKIKPVLIEEQGLSIIAIIRNAVKHHCDLIVCGNYGASGYRQGYLGTTTYNVIKFAPCPVLVVPAGKKWPLFKKPIFPVRLATTLSRHYNLIHPFFEKTAVLDILAFTAAGQADKTQGFSESVLQVQKKLEQADITTNVQFNDSGLLSLNVLAKAEINNSDLIIMAPSIDISFKPFCIGPNMHSIINNAKIPVLIINKRNQQPEAVSRSSVKNKAG